VRGSRGARRCRPRIASGRAREYRRASRGIGVFRRVASLGRVSTVLVQRFCMRVATCPLVRLARMVRFLRFFRPASPVNSDCSGGVRCQFRCQRHSEAAHPVADHLASRDRDRGARLGSRSSDVGGRAGWRLRGTIGPTFARMLRSVWLGGYRRAGTITIGEERGLNERQDPPRSEAAVFPWAVSESALAAPRSDEAVAAPVVSADYPAASAFPAVVPLLTSIAVLPSARVPNIWFLYRDLIRLFGLGRPDTQSSNM
jgi:hypothetical protein